ncbi:MAG: hypothetical protein OXS47_06965 [Chloroflexota bacterium]|nr:hypothetical protein [Chloroflexota bacterium]
MTTDEKNAPNAEPEAADGDGRPSLGLFASSTTLDELVEQQGVGPFVWPEPCDDEDKFDVDEFLDSIFGGRKRR